MLFYHGLLQFGSLAFLLPTPLLFGALYMGKCPPTKIFVVVVVSLFLSAVSVCARVNPPTIYFYIVHSQRTFRFGWVVF